MSINENTSLKISSHDATAFTSKQSWRAGKMLFETVIQLTSDDSKLFLYDKPVDFVASSDYPIFITTTKGGFVDLANTDTVNTAYFLTTNSGGGNNSVHNMGLLGNGDTVELLNPDDMGTTVFPDVDDVPPDDDDDEKGLPHRTTASPGHSRFHSLSSVRFFSTMK